MAAEQHTDIKKTEGKGVEGLLRWAKDNKLGAGIFLAAIATVFTVIGAQVNEALKAPATVEARVHGTPHKPSDPSSTHQSVWEITLTYDEGKELENVVLQLPFKGVARVKTPRVKGVASTTVTEEGVVFPRMRAQDQIEMTVWSDTALDGVEAGRIRVTHKEGAGDVDVQLAEGAGIRWKEVAIAFAFFHLVSLVMGYFLRKVIKDESGAEIAKLRLDLQKSTKKSDLLYQAFLDVYQRSGEGDLKEVLQRAREAIEGREGAKDEEA